MIPGMKLAAACAVVLVGLTGCGPTAVDADDSSKALARVVLDESSDYEKEILGDLVVTKAEYEKAVLDTLACVRRRIPEVEASEPYLRADGIGLTFDLSAHTGTDPQAFADYSKRLEDANVCEDFRAEVEAVWYEQNRPTGAERVEMQQEFFDCASEAGVEGLVLGMGADEIIQRMVELQNGAFSDCWFRYEIAWREPFGAP